MRPYQRMEGMPLSMAQTHVWLKFQETGVLSSQPVLFRLEGPFDRRLLERCLGEIMRRHDILRTRVVQVDGTPVHVVRPFAGWTVAVCSLEDLPVDRKDDEALRIPEAVARRASDMAHEALFRAVLLRLDPLTHLLALIVCDLVFDAVSVDIFFNELTALYGAWSAGRPSPLSEPTVQYADFARWQQGELAKGALGEQMTYWTSQLGGALPRLSWPSPSSSPSAPRYEDIESVQIADAVTRGLKKLSRDIPATLHMTLLAAFNTFLARLTRATDIVVGAPVSGRRHSWSTDLIGPFVNLLAFRTDLSGNPSFEDVVRRVRSTTLDAYAHQDLPLEQLLRALQPDLYHRRQCPFDVMFNYIVLNQTLSRQRGERYLDLCKVTPAHRRRDQAATMPVVLFVTEDGDDLRLDLRYQQGVFSHDDARSLLLQFAGLLEHITRAPLEPIQSYTV